MSRAMRILGTVILAGLLATGFAVAESGGDINLYLGQRSASGNARPSSA